MEGRCPWLKFAQDCLAQAQGRLARYQSDEEMLNTEQICRGQRVVQCWEQRIAAHGALGTCERCKGG